MPPPPPPPAPNRAACEASTGAVAASELNWFENLLGFKTEDIGQSEKTWVNGWVDEVHIGTKWEIVQGKVTEAHENYKLEQILINETKINIGTLTEAFFAIRLKYDRAWTHEFNLGYKVEVWPGSGQIWDASWTHKSADDKRKLDKAKKTISDWEKTVLAKAELEAKNAFQEIRSLRREIKMMKSHGDTFYAKAEEMKHDGRTVMIDVRGDYEHTTGSLTIEASKKVDIDATSKILLEAGDKVECGSSKVTVNGTDITVSK